MGTMRMYILFDRIIQERPTWQWMLILSTLLGSRSMTTAIQLHQLRQFEGRCELALVKWLMRRTDGKMFPINRSFLRRSTELFITHRDLPKVNSLLSCSKSKSLIPVSGDKNRSIFERRYSTATTFNNYGITYDQNWYGYWSSCRSVCHDIDDILTKFSLQGIVNSFRQLHVGRGAD